MTYFRSASVRSTKHELELTLFELRIFIVEVSYNVADKLPHVYRRGVGF